MNTELKHQRVRFADFEFDCNSRDLRRGGASLKLQPQPAKVLAVLIRRAGSVVARQELANELWGSGTFVDFEQGLNYAIRQIRSALGDDADQPRFLETLPKRGYRFIAPLEDQLEPEVTLTAITLEKPVTPRRPTRQIGIALIIIIATGISFVVGFRLRGRVPPVTPNHPITSLAVLPLHNLSHDPDQEYFSDGMTEELITDLAKSASLRVISHTSVQRYKVSSRSLPEIARELGVDAIVEGTVMRSNDRVRITAQLIDARSDQHLWADSYEGELRDMLSLQDEVAQRIATQVGIKMQTGQDARGITRQLNSAAYEAYLKGNFYWNRSTCDGSNKGRSFYQQAVAEDPTFAAAYAGLAQAYFVLGDWGCSPREEAFSKSKASALKTLELDPASAPAHTWLGTLAFFHDSDWNNADKDYSKAVDLDPNYAPARLLYAVFLVSMGKQERGLGEMRIAQNLDPTAEFTNMVSVHILYLARQYDQAIEQAKNALEYNPDSWGTYFWLGAAYERKGMYDQAIQAYLKSRSLQGTQPASLELFRRAYHQDGIRGYWKRERETLQTNNAELCSIRSIYAQFDSKRTLEYLNRSIEHHCGNIRTLKVDSFYDDIREDPMFKQDLVRLHLN